MGADRSSLPPSLSPLPGSVSPLPSRGRGPVPILPDARLSALVPGASSGGVAAAAQRPHLPNDTATDREKLRALDEPGPLRPVPDELVGVRVVEVAAARHAGGSILSRERQRKIIGWEHVGG